MDNEHFPHTGVGDLHPELYWRDLEFFNYHINHDKMAWFYRSFDPSEAHRHEDHFTYWDADHYIVSSVGTGDIDVMPYWPCGALWVETDVNDLDREEITTPCTWAFITGYPLFFEIRAFLTMDLLGDFYAGYMEAPLWAGSPDEGFYFYKPDGTSRLYFVVETNDVQTMVDTGIDVETYFWFFGYWLRLCAHWDGAGNIRWFVVNDYDRTIIASGVVTAGFEVGWLFYFSFGLMNGDQGEENIMLVDYIKLAQKHYPGIDLFGLGYFDGRPPA